MRSVLDLGVVSGSGLLGAAALVAVVAVAGGGAARDVLPLAGLLFVPAWLLLVLLALAHARPRRFAAWVAALALASLALVGLR